MQTNFRGRDFIGDLDFTKEEVETILDVAWDLKRKRALGEPHAYLRDKVLAMLFFFSSTRTRENRTPIFNRGCMSSPFQLCLFSPIFIFHGGKLHGGRFQRRDFQVHAAIGADQDLTDLGAFYQVNFRSTFGTIYSRHFHSPLILWI